MVGVGGGGGERGGVCVLVHVKELDQKTTQAEDPHSQI